MKARACAGTGGKEAESTVPNEECLPTGRKPDREVTKKRNTKHDVKEGLTTRSAGDMGGRKS